MATRHSRLHVELWTAGGHVEVVLGQVGGAGAARDLLLDGRGVGEVPVKLHLGDVVFALLRIYQAKKLSARTEERICRKSRR